MPIMHPVTAVPLPQVLFVEAVDVPVPAIVPVPAAPVYQYSSDALPLKPPLAVIVALFPETIVVVPPLDCGA